MEVISRKRLSSKILSNIEFKESMINMHDKNKNMLRLKYLESNRKSQKKWQNNHPEQVAIRRLIRRVIVNSSRNSNIVLGYGAVDLKKHIESQFKYGMSWDNRSEWHIDHIKPIKAFIDEGITDPKVINALDNLQPLWASENLSKGAKW